MLSRLQAGVDAEVAKWQTKVDEKDEELQDMKKKMENPKVCHKQILQLYRM